MSLSATASAAVSREGILPAPLARRLARAASLILLGALGLAAAVLVSRRAVGAVSAPLPAVALVAVGLAVALTATMARRTMAQGAVRRWLRLSSSVLATIAVLAVTIAISLPGSSVVGLAVLWLAVVAEEAWSWRPRHRERPRRREPDGDSAQPPMEQVAAGDRTSLARAVADGSAAVELPQERVVQQITRLQHPDGTDQIIGWMRVTFQPGQRQANAHLAFCPPFSRTPEAVLERLDGPQVRIKRIQVLPFGARFDMKLKAPAEQTSSLLLRVSAEVPAAESSLSDLDEA